MSYLWDLQKVIVQNWQCTRSTVDFFSVWTLNRWLCNTVSLGKYISHDTQTNQLTEISCKCILLQCLKWRSSLKWFEKVEIMVKISVVQWGSVFFKWSKRWQMIRYSNAIWISDKWMPCCLLMYPGPVFERLVKYQAHGPTIWNLNFKKIPIVFLLNI